MVVEMIYELRRYLIHPSYISDFMTEAPVGVALEKKYLGELVCYLKEDIGRGNRIVHIWRYADLNDRERCRQELYKDPSWIKYYNKVILWIDQMENQILREIL